MLLCLTMNSNNTTSGNANNYLGSGMTEGGFIDTTGSTNNVWSLPQDNVGLQQQQQPIYHNDHQGDYQKQQEDSMKLGAPLPGPLPSIMEHYPASVFSSR